MVLGDAARVELREPSLADITLEVYHSISQKYPPLARSPDLPGLGLFTHARGENLLVRYSRCPFAGVAGCALLGGHGCIASSLPSGSSFALPDRSLAVSLTLTLALSLSPGLTPVAVILASADDTKPRCSNFAFEGRERLYASELFYDLHKVNHDTALILAAKLRYARMVYKQSLPL